MSAPTCTRFQRVIEGYLEETGLPWEIKNGPKHKKVFIKGKLIYVFSHGGKEDTNARSRVYSIIMKAAKQCS